MGQLFLAMCVVLAMVAARVFLFRKPKSGMLTLIAVLLALAGIAVVWLPICGPISNPETRRTEAILSTICTGLELEMANTGLFPASIEQTVFKSSNAAAELRALKALPANPPGFLDGWGQPIVIELLEPGRFRLASSGRDLKPGTKDDLVVVWPAPMPGPKPTTTTPASTPVSAPAEIGTKP